MNPFQETGGLKLGDLLEGIAWIQERGPIEALALTAYDPGGDPDGAVVEAAFLVLEQVPDAG